MVFVKKKLSIERSQAVGSSLRLQLDHHEVTKPKITEQKPFLPKKNQKKSKLIKKQKI